MQKVVSGVTVELVQGDITAQKDIGAVVNAANSQLRPGGGVAGAIHRAAGPELEEEGVPLAPIKPGEAVITKGYNLPNSHVIHCLGPVFGADKPEDKLLADCYKNALALAEEHNLQSIAFPAISTGAFGYPIEEAAEIALKTVVEKVKTLQNVNLVRFVLFSEKDLKVHEKVLSRL